MSAVRCKFRPSPFGHQCYMAGQAIPNGPMILHGSHRDGKTNRDVEHLYFHDCNFLGFPFNIPDLFVNLTGLEIQKCQLRFLIRDFFARLTRLKYLYVLHCELKSLPGDLLRDLVNLERVSFANNKLVEIAPELLDHLYLLQIVDFRGNTAINVWHNARDPKSNKLDEVKQAIRTLCQPQPRPQNLVQENQILRLENANLKQALENQSRAFKKQLEDQPRAKQAQENPVFSDLKRILADDAFKDLTIRCNEGTFEGHKLILAARSPELAEFLRHDPDVRELDFKDIPRETFRAVLQFIYTNHLPAAGVNYAEIFVAAEKLRIDSLAAFSAAQAIRTIDEKNAFDLLLLANGFDHREMREAAFGVIQTRIFPDRKLDEQLVRQPEKLRKLIEMKKKLEEEYEAMFGGEAAGTSK